MIKRIAVLAGLGLMLAAPAFAATGAEAVDPLIFRLAIFVLAIFVGYYVVWSVTPALHTPLMAVTNAISAISVVAAIEIAGLPSERSSAIAKVLATIAVAMPVETVAQFEPAVPPLIAKLATVPLLGWLVDPCSIVTAVMASIFGRRWSGPPAGSPGRGSAPITSPIERTRFGVGW